MIPFPKMHIADSVINRVLNTLEGNEKLLSSAQMPDVIDPKPLGMQIDTAVSTPPQPAELPPQQQAAGDAGMAISSVLGGSPFSGALIGS